MIFKYTAVVREDDATLSEINGIHHSSSESTARQELGELGIQVVTIGHADVNDIRIANLKLLTRKPVIRRSAPEPVKRQENFIFRILRKFRGD